MRDLMFARNVKGFLISGIAAQSFRLFLIPFLFILYCLSTTAQDRKPIFQSIQQGLSHQLIHTIIKDSKGYMWIGTHDGLNKFDGSNFVIYENSPNDSTSLLHNSIHALIEDRQHNLWIATSQGVNLYNREKDNFIDIDHIKGNVNHLNTIYISALCEDAEGNIWIGTFGYGINVYNYKQHKFYYYSHYDPDKSSVNSQYITALAKDNDGNIWVGTYTGLDMYDRKQKVFKHFVYNASDNNSLSNNHVTSLFVNRSGDLWAGTLRGGLNKLVRTNGAVSFQRYQHTSDPNSLSDNFVFSICEDKKGNLWVGTDKGGLNCLNQHTGKTISYRVEEGNPYSLSSNSIWSLYSDDNDILWIGTYNKGLNVIDDKYQKFEPYQRSICSKNTLNSNDVRGFSEDKEGNIWMATDGGGICRFNPQTRQFTKSVMNRDGENPLTRNDVIEVIVDSLQNFWVGMWGGGVDHLDKNCKRIKNYKIEGVQGAGDNNVILVYEDKHRNIWVGTAGSGLFLYDRKTDKFIPIINKDDALKLLNTAFISSVLEDCDGTIWIGTLYGLVCLRKSSHGEFRFRTFYHNDKPGSISSNRVIYVFEDSKKRLWLGTEDNGLNLFNKRDSSFTVYLKGDGLPNNTIKGMLEDAHGNLWVSTNKGISKFNPARRTFTNYTQEDGLNSDEFYKGCLKSSSGEFYFGSNKGFNLFYPDSIKTNTYIPPVYLTDFKIFNKSVPIGIKGSPLQKHISATSRITLTYKQTSFSIEFVALNYTRSLRNQYVYMLEGLDHEWNRAGAQRSATYTNIHPGTYTFKVRGSNNNGLFNPVPTTLEITVLPPWWQTVWAYAIYVLVFFSLLYAFIKLQMIRIKQLQILKLERMRRQKDEEVNQMKLQFFTNISHEFRTPLSLILTPLENLISTASLKSEIKSQLTLIYRNADRLFKLVNELMDFTKAEHGQLKLMAQQCDMVKFCRELSAYFSDIAEKRTIEYRFISDVEHVDVWIDKDKMEKIVLNLLSNAFKYTPDKGQIVLKLSKVLDEASNQTGEGLVKLSVIDNGSGILPEYVGKVFDRFFQSPEEGRNHQTGTGIGLSLTKSLVELHGGTIAVTSQKFKETCFTVTLPLGNAHFKLDEISSTPVYAGSEQLNDTAIDQKSLKKGKTQENASIILVVEDNVELRSYIVSILNGTYKVLEAANGKAGFDLAVEHVPDLIISDIIMPELSGIELCKQLKGEISTSHIPVVLLTSKTTVESKIEGIETGADAYITKPFNVRMLEVTIKNLIETRKKLYQRFSQDVYIMPKEISNNLVDQGFLERIIDYIDKNMADESLSVENLASHLYMSRSQAYRKIKALTGQSATEFIRIVRLKMAVKLIESGQFNVSEIAFKVGFASPAYFTKCFKEQFGKLPSEYLPDNVKKKKAD